MTAQSPDVAAARRRADEARTRLFATVEELIAYGQELQDKLAPGHIARDAWEAAKTKSADIAEDAVDAVRKRPVAAGGAIAALALFIAREPLMDLAGKMMNGKAKTKPKKASKPKKERVEKIDERTQSTE